MEQGTNPLFWTTALCCGWHFFIIGATYMIAKKGSPIQFNKNWATRTKGVTTYYDDGYTDEYQEFNHPHQ